jgi:hypothetical protein
MIQAASAAHANAAQTPRGKGLPRARSSAAPSHTRPTHQLLPAHELPTLTPIPSPPHPNRRRVLKVPDATKPLLVSAVQLRTGLGRLQRSRPCLLVVTAAGLFVLDAQSQGELEARDGSHASIQLALRASEVGGPCRRVFDRSRGWGGGAPSRLATQQAPGPDAASQVEQAPGPPRIKEAADPPPMQRNARPSTQQVVDVLLVPGGLRLEHKSPGAVKVSPSAFGFGPAPGGAAAAAPATFGADAATGAPSPGPYGGFSDSGGGRAAGAPRGRAFGSADGLLMRAGACGAGVSSGAAAAAAAAAHSQQQQQRCAGGLHSSASTPELPGSSSEDGGAAAARMSEAEAVHQVAHCTLLFDDAEAARAAAAAIAYARSADADAARWLASGLPTNFAIELAGAAFDAASHPAAPALPAPGAAASQSQAALGPAAWGAAAVPLPRAWGALLSRTEAAAAAVAAHASAQSRRVSRSHSLSGYVRDLLPPPAGAGRAPSLGGAAAPAAAPLHAAAGGPATLVVHVSTPLGLASARIRLEHLVALQHDEAMCEVLAAPAAAAAAAASGGAGAVAPAGSDGSALGVQPCFYHEVTALVKPRDAAAAAAPGGAAEVRHAQSVYAVLRIALSKAPGSPAAADPLRQLQVRRRTQEWADRAAAAAAAQRQSTQSGGGGAWRGAVWALAPVVVALAVQYALLTAKPLDLHSLLDVLTVAVLAVFVANWLRPKPATASVESAAVAVEGSAPAAGAPGAEEQEALAAAAADQWTVHLVGASLFTQPGAYVQMQIRDFKAAAAAAAEYAAAATAAADFDVSPLAAGGLGARGGAKARKDLPPPALAAGSFSKAGPAAIEESEVESWEAGSEAEGWEDVILPKLPTLISDPEPAWMTRDIQQRCAPAG